MLQSTGKHRSRFVGWFLLTLFMVWVVFVLAVIQFPVSDRAARADAVVLLGPPDEESLPAAQRLIGQGISDVLVISSPFGRPALCDSAPAGVTVRCPVPAPPTTRGEAQMIGRMSAQNGWKRIVVMTWPTHLSRSRVLIQRCYDGELQMVDYDNSYGWTLPGRVQEAIYQTGAFLKTLIQPDC